VSGIERGQGLFALKIKTLSIMSNKFFDSKWRTSYPNEVSGIENGITQNDIKVRTFSILPYKFVLLEMAG